uniref:Uncharacterized protein n=1 Tax=Chromera velia CCMP2878 TaxID=1169474 RepID=A0A0G4F5C9_9ALVE|eukprot:Cvel_165.t1-p1 / transcript=Cvel_165.t1 / gene=Cvel_165 / organism=Chromera_velia_CCMP2878 / gene_product=hypothetical protein / transcript_product=hypothetical protein / location=Cvel_scaffold10:149567-150649(+) / protein_length=328 / sequence_SO=supercontig / SO=protein_coding / is_pseudo=false
MAALPLVQGFSSSPAAAAGGSQAVASRRSGRGGKAKPGAAPPQAIGGKRDRGHLMPPDDIQTDGLTNPPSPSAQKDSPKRPKSAVLPPPPPPFLPSYSKSLSQTLTNSLRTSLPDRHVAASAMAMVPPPLIPIVEKAPGQPPAGGRPYLTFPHLTASTQGESVFSTPPRRQSSGQTLPEFGHDTQPRLGPNTNDDTEPTALSLAGLPPLGARTEAPTKQQTREGPPEGMLMDAFVGDRGFFTGSAVPQTAEPSVSLSPPLHQPPQPSKVTATPDPLPPPGPSLLFLPPVSSRPPQDSGGEDLGAMLGLGRHNCEFPPCDLFFGCSQTP